MLTADFIGLVDSAFPPVPPARSMPPPSSPPTYTPLGHHVPAPTLPPPTPTSATSRDLPPLNSLNARPGSSMSLSNILGAEPERPHREAPPSTASFSLPSMKQNPGPSFQRHIMSPLQTTSRQMLGEYQPFPRSHSPDRFRPLPESGPRQHRSSSGGAATFGRSTLEDSYHAPSSKASVPRYGEPSPSYSFLEASRRVVDGVQNPRRSSLSGPLQRQMSPPPLTQSIQQSPGPLPTHYRGNHTPQEPYGYDRDQTSVRKDTDHAQRRPESVSGEDITREMFRSMDSRTVPGAINQAPFAHREDDRHRPNQWEITRSPEERRSVAQEHASTAAYELLPRAITSHPELSSHPHGLLTTEQPSQNERHAFADRHDHGKSSKINPFPASFGSQQQPYHFPLADEQQRKLSEEVAQHRSILNLSTETRRSGRASPVPQAVQGAQAQMVGPETAIKSESGRVFSGIGGGFSTITTGPVRTDTPSLISGSPFRREDAASRSAFDDTGRKGSRTSSGLGKRGRKVRGEDSRFDSEPIDGRQTPISSRTQRKARQPPAYYR